MTTIPLIHNGDLFRVYVDEFNDLEKIELYPNNENIHPEEVDWNTLDHELQERITSKILKAYGFRLNVGDVRPVRQADKERDGRKNSRAQQLHSETGRPVDTGDFTL